MSKQLSDGFKRSVYWNNCQTIPAKVIDNEINISVSFQGDERLFVLAYDVPGNNNNEAGIKSNRKYFLPTKEIKNYNILIDEKNIYDQPINDLIKQYNELGKISTGQGDDYTTGFLLGYVYFKDNYRLIVVDLNKQKALDAYPRAIQQIMFQGFTGQKIKLYTIVGKSKETV